MFFRRILGIATGVTPRDDRHFVQLFERRNIQSSNGMTCLMLSHQINMFIALQHASPLRSQTDLIFGVFKIAHGDNTLVGSRGQQRASLITFAKSAPEYIGMPLAALQINIGPNGTFWRGPLESSPVRASRASSPALDGRNDPDATTPCQEYQHGWSPQ